MVIARVGCCCVLSEVFAESEVFRGRKVEVFANKGIGFSIVV